MKLKGLIVILAILMMATSVSAGIFDFITGSVVTESCSDSDNGLSENIAGSVSIPTGIYKDKCSPVANAVEEQACNDEGSVYSELILCSEGTTCKEDSLGRGYCAEEEVEEGFCQDSDGGLNEDVKGYVNTLTSIHQDKCSDTANGVNEWACSEAGTAYYEIILCGEGKTCEDGACVEGESSLEDLVVPDDKIKALEDRVKALEKKVKDLEALIDDCCDKPAMTTTVQDACKDVDESCYDLCIDGGYSEDCNGYCFNKCVSNCKNCADNYKTCYEECQEKFPGVTIETAVTTTVAAIEDEGPEITSKKSVTADRRSEIESAPTSAEKKSGINRLLRVIFGKS